MRRRAIPPESPVTCDNSVDKLVHFRFFGDVHRVAFELTAVPCGKSLQGIEILLPSVGDDGTGVVRQERQSDGAAQSARSSGHQYHSCCRCRVGIHIPYLSRDLPS